MGEQFASLHVRHGDTRRVSAVVGTELETDVVRMSEPVAGWISLYPDASPYEANGPGRRVACRLGERLSGELGTVSVVLHLSKDEGCGWWVFEGGTLVAHLDAYTPMRDPSHARQGDGNPEVLARLSEPSVPASRFAEIVGQLLYREPPPEWLARVEELMKIDRTVATESANFHERSARMKRIREQPDYQKLLADCERLRPLREEELLAQMATLLGVVPEMVRRPWDRTLTEVPPQSVAARNRAEEEARARVDAWRQAQVRRGELAWYFQPDSDHEVLGYDREGRLWLEIQEQKLALDPGSGCRCEDADPSLAPPERTSGLAHTEDGSLRARAEDQDDGMSIVLEPADGGPPLGRLVGLIVGTEFAFTPTGRHLLLADGRTLAVHSAPDLKELARIPWGEGGDDWARLPGAFSKDGRFFASADDDHDRDATRIALHSVDTLQPVWTLKIEPAVLSLADGSIYRELVGPCRLLFGPHDQRLFVTTMNSGVRVIDASNGNLEATLTNPGDVVSREEPNDPPRFGRPTGTLGIAVPSHSRWIAVLYQDDILRFHELGSSRLVASYEVGHATDLWELAIGPDDATILVWSGFWNDPVLAFRAPESH